MKTINTSRKIGEAICRYFLPIVAIGVLAIAIVVVTIGFIAATSAPMRNDQMVELMLEKGYGSPQCDAYSGVCRVEIGSCKGQMIDFDPRDMSKFSVRDDPKGEISPSARELLDSGRFNACRD